MPEALFFIDWDNHIGSFLKYKYPSNSDLDLNVILQFLISMQSIASSEVLQIQDNQNLFLIYGIPGKKNINESFNYTFLALKLKPYENIYLDYYKIELTTLGFDLLNAPNNEKKLKFEILVDKLFKNKQYKIVFLGLPNSGKTSTQKFFFQKVNYREILNKTIIPTQGFETEKINYLDLEINLFDTSGQELDLWLHQNKYILTDANLIVFFFSVDDWKIQKDVIKNYVSHLISLKTNSDLNISKIIIFCHKIDLILHTDKNSYTDFKSNVLNELKDTNIPIFFTTIENGGNEELFSAFQLIINEYSELFSRLIEILQPLIEKFELIPLYLLDNYNRLLINFQYIRTFATNKQNEIYIPSIEDLYLIFPNISTKSVEIYNTAFCNPRIMIYLYENKESKNNFYENLIIIDLRPIISFLGFIVFKLKSEISLAKIMDEYKYIIEKFKL